MCVSRCHLRVLLAFNAKASYLDFCFVHSSVLLLIILIFIISFGKSYLKNMGLIQMVNSMVTGQTNNWNELMFITMKLQVNKIVIVAFSVCTLIVNDI